MSRTSASKETSTIRSLVDSRRLALTTLAADDWRYADRLQTATVRGDHELLYWGVGPELDRGDIVALYTPKSLFLPQCDWGKERGTSIKL